MKIFRRVHIVFVLLISLVVGLSQCKKEAEDTPSLDDRIAAIPGDLSSLPEVVHPTNNETSPEKVQLGKLLFWDPILSGERDIACASCHHPDFGFADGLDLSIGVGGMGVGPNRQEESGERIPRIGRNAPTIINTAYNGMLDPFFPYSPEEAPQFWDSRLHSLEEQSLAPIANRAEMAGDAFPVEFALDSIINRLKAIPAYLQLFQAAFEGEQQPVSSVNLGKAIAAFERSIVSRNSPYDRYVKGELNALTDRQKEGLLLFFGDANCSSCHIGPMFSDYKLTVHGAKDNPNGNFPDRGGEEAFKFRTPTLRNIELTAPYTHGGMYSTLQEALGFYNQGKSENPLVADNDLDDHVEPLNLPPHKLNDIVEFLKALTDEGFDREIPGQVPSGLNPGGNI